MLVYINQGTMSAVKGELALYNQHFILGQLFWHKTVLKICSNTILNQMK